MTLRSRLSRPPVVCLAIALAATTARAQAPSIAATTPQAAKPGATLDVTIAGGNLAGPTQLVTSFPCEAVLSPDVKDNGTQPASVVYRMTVPADAPVGVHALRMTSPGGTSPLKLFVVDDLPSIAGLGSNTSPATAQPIDLPVAVDGAAPARGLHFYKIKADAGQRISFEVLARRMGSTMDPMLRILDTNGRELAYSEDEPGLSTDAQLSYTFNTAGEYVVEVRDVAYRGGGAYRLRIGDFPCVTVPYPMGGRRGSDVSVSFAGSDLENVVPLTLKTPSDPLVRWIPVTAKRVGGTSSGFATLALGDSEEFTETEPNNEAAQASRVTLGGNFNGRLGELRDVDRFVFSAKKGENYTFSAVTRQQASPCDLVLELYKADGAKVAEADDAGDTDAVLKYAFPDDGDYTLLAVDRANRGGSRFAYRIESAPTRAGFALSASADQINVPAGGTAMLTVGAVRDGYDGPIAVSVVDLPAGVTTVPTVIGPAQKSVVLTLQSTPEAAAGKAMPIRVVGTAKIGDADFQATADLTATLKTQFSGMPFPPLPLSRATVLAIAPKPTLLLRVEPAEIVFGQNLSATVKVVATRGAGIDEAIALAVTPEKEGLPAGITAAVKPIDKGANEVQVVFSATDKAPLGEFTGVLTGTHKKENAAVTSIVPGLTLKLREPLTVSVTLGEAKLKKGGELRVKATVARNPALAAEVALTFQNLPKGVTAAAATIPADKSEVEIVLTAAQDADVGEVKTVTVKGDAAVGNAKFTATSAAAALTVE
ncbi:MAG: hypothetical protein WD648_16115 [Planctomycetaceae bacterium]